MAAKFLCLLLFLVGIAAAEQRTYLVKRAEHFPQDRFLYTISPSEYKYFVDTGRKTIEAAEGQPFRLTSYTISPNGRYALLSVDYADSDERSRFDNMADRGLIVLISTMDVVTTFDPRIGGTKTEPVFTQLASLPTDFYEVSVSSE